MVWLSEHKRRRGRKAREELEGNARKEQGRRRNKSAENCRQAQRENSVRRLCKHLSARAAGVVHHVLDLHSLCQSHGLGKRKKKA